MNIYGLYFEPKHLASKRVLLLFFPKTLVLKLLAPLQEVNNSIKPRPVITKLDRFRVLDFIRV